MLKNPEPLSIIWSLMWILTEKYRAHSSYLDPDSKLTGKKSTVGHNSFDIYYRNEIDEELISDVENFLDPSKISRYLKYLRKGAISQTWDVNNLEYPWGDGFLGGGSYNRCIEVDFDSLATNSANSRDMQFLYSYDLLKDCLINLPSMNGYRKRYLDLPTSKFVEVRSKAFPRMTDKMWLNIFISTEGDLVVTHKKYTYDKDQQDLGALPYIIHLNTEGNLYIYISDKYKDSWRGTRKHRISNILNGTKKSFSTASWQDFYASIAYIIIKSMCMHLLLRDDVGFDLVPTLTKFQCHALFSELVNPEGVGPLKECYKGLTGTSEDPEFGGDFFNTDSFEGGILDLFESLKSRSKLRHYLIKTEYNLNMHRLLSRNN